jgi:hypothetical protein
MSEECFDVPKRPLEFLGSIAQASRRGCPWGVEVLFPISLKSIACSTGKERLENYLGSFVPRQYFVRKHAKCVYIPSAKTMRLFNESRTEDRGSFVEALMLPRKSCCDECSEGADQCTNESERNAEPECLIESHMMPNKSRSPTLPGFIVQRPMDCWFSHSRRIASTDLQKK